MSKVTIELSPFAAIAIMHVFKEMFLIRYAGVPECAAMRDVLREYEETLSNNITQEQIDDAMLHLSAQEIIGAMPKQTGPEGK